MADIVATRAFFAAVHAGDVGLVAQHFAQPHVRLRVDSMNVRALAGSPDLWFHSAMHGDFVFPTIVECGHVELLSWFISQPMLTDTLRLLLPRIALTILESADAEAREMLEIMLASSVFTSAMTDRERHDTMAELLSTAASARRNHWIEPLLAHGADPTQSYAFVTPLFAASEDGDAETIQRLVSNGAIVTQSDLVTQGVWEDNVDVVRELLRLGADPRSATIDHNAALLLAAQNRSLEIIDLLVRDGIVDIDARDNDGRTPAMIVADDDEGDPDSFAIEIIEFLIGRNPDIFAVDNRGSTVLHWAARTNNVQLLRTLLALGCDPNAQNQRGCTPLRELAECTLAYTIKDMVDVLLQCGADPHIPCESGLSSMHMLQQKSRGREYIKRRQQFFCTTA